MGRQPQTATWLQQQRKRSAMQELMLVLALLKEHEGFRPTEYLCTQGHRTIGYGHRLDPGESIDHLTQREAETLLVFDARQAAKNAREVYSPHYDYLPPSAQDALTLMAFQLGKKGLAGFKKLRIAVLASDWQGAARQCLESRWNDQTPVRAKLCATLFLKCK